MIWIFYPYTLILNRICIFASFSRPFNEYWTTVLYLTIILPARVGYLTIITHPLIFLRFYWLLYVTWCKFTGRLSRNDPRLLFALLLFPLKRNKASGKKPAQEFHLFIFTILHARKTNSFCRCPVMFTSRSWSQMLFRKVQKCQQNMLSTSLKV